MSDLNSIENALKNFKLLKAPDEYKLVLENADFNSNSGSKICSGAGIYFWIAKIKNKSQTLYKIYIGRTNNLNRRFTEYCSGFQVHSPNDYKVRFFFEFIKDKFPGEVISFDLYFRCCPPISTDTDKWLKDTEKEEIATYSPLMINRRLLVTDELKSKLQLSYKEYYSDIFSRKLNLI